MARKVRTPKGEHYFGKPRGSIIGPDGEIRPHTRPVTIERLQSLRSQIQAAQVVGDRAQIGMLGQVFERELRAYSVGRSVADVLAELTEPKRTAASEKS